MIKFFRKIRQNSIKENKTINYLKYATGEIVLVVLGILIALQINNCNENRKERNKEQIILNNLKEDFQANQKIIENILFVHNYHLKELINYLEHLGPNVPALTDSIYKFDVSDYGKMNLIDGNLLSVINSDILM